MGAGRVVGGRYELIRPVGRGGMGEVWAGLDTRLDRRVAVKLLRPNALPAGVDQQVLIRRFEREARLTALLEHPGVPAVHDTGTDSGDLFLVMQLIDGADLADFQAEHEPVPIGWVAAVGAQVATVLAAAHAANLVHRDLKPRNLMITLDGHVKVLDFGLAVLRDGDGSVITRTAESIGTPAYMAPEQAMHGAAGPASDIYSLGCVLYELVTGRPVFTATTPLALMHRHYSGIPTPAATLRPEAAGPLNELVARMLAKHAPRRPSAADVRDRLTALIPAPTGRREIPMDPTRPFADRITAPAPVPAGALEPPTTPAMPPAPPAPAQQPIFPAPLPTGSTGAVTIGMSPMTPLPTAGLSMSPLPGSEPGPARHGFAAGMKRAGDGTLLVSSFTWTGFGLIVLTTDEVPTGIVGFGTGLLMIWIAAAVRKTRLRLPHLWSVDRTPAGPASGAELTARVLLLLTGGIVLLAAVVQAFKPETRLYITLSGFLFAAAFLVPGTVMLLRPRAPAGTAPHRVVPHPPSAGRWG